MSGEPHNRAERLSKYEFEEQSARRSAEFALLVDAAQAIQQHIAARGGTFHAYESPPPLPVYPDPEDQVEDDEDDLLPVDDTQQSARMITFDHDNARFTYRVAGIALHNGRVLLNTVQGFDFWFLPGGRCELREAATEALVREMREEMSLEVRVERLLWVVENFFVFQGITNHELGLYFLMSLPPDSGLYDTQELFAGTEQSIDLIFQWHRLDELDRVPLFPAFLRQTLQAIPATVEHIVHTDSDE